MLFKCEWYNPTCSFKDRGTTVMLSLLRQQGVSAVLEDSSGNGGASVACYAAAGGLDATIMAPDSTSPSKTVQMRAHGARRRAASPSSARSRAAAPLARQLRVIASKRKRGRESKRIWGTPRVRR